MPSLHRLSGGVFRAPFLLSIQLWSLERLNVPPGLIELLVAVVLNASCRILRGGSLRAGLLITGAVDGLPIMLRFKLPEANMAVPVLVLPRPEAQVAPEAGGQTNAEFLT
jgi:hypothetical protein